MNNKDIINSLLKQISDGLSNITETSYPLCKNLDANVSNSCARINNTAYELTRITMILKNQINITE